MNTTGEVTEATTGALSKLKTFEPPAIDEQARQHLVEAGWNCLLSWVGKHAPPEVGELCRSLNVLEYVLLVQSEHDGLVDRDINEHATEQAISLLNCLARLNYL